MTGVDQCKPQFFKLVERYCQLGRLLPAIEDIETDNDVELARIKIVLAEMTKTKAQIGALLIRTT